MSTKKRKNSRVKGARGEREVAKAMGDWFGVDMARTPSSGGFKTPKFRQDWNCDGDLVCPDESFPFVVEVKLREGWTLDSIITGSEVAPIWDWWGQACRQRGDKIPLLVFRRNHHPWLYMLPKTKGASLPGKHVFTKDPTGQAVVIGLLDDFCKTKPATWIKALGGMTDVKKD